MAFIGSVTIYAEVASKPSGWSSGYCFTTQPTIWGCSLGYDDGLPYVASFVKTANMFSSGVVRSAPYRAGYSFSQWAYLVSINFPNINIAYYTMNTVVNAPNNATLFSQWV